MAGVLEELDFKLASTFQIKNKPMTSGDEVDKLEVFIFIHTFKAHRPLVTKFTLCVAGQF